MKKLMAMMAVAGLLAVTAACSSRNQGGTSENQSYTNPSQTGGAMGTPENSKQGTYDQGNLNQQNQATPNGSATETETNNATGGQGGTSLTPGGTSSGYGANGNQSTAPENNNATLPENNNNNNLNNTNSQDNLPPR